MGRQIAEFSVDPRMFSLVGPRLYRGNLARIWVREVLQNSMDAGAKNIDIRMRKQSYKGILPADLDLDRAEAALYEERRGEIIELTCEDDGHGMSEDTFINSFLRLGSSEKAEFSIGGWGVAKAIILCGQYWEVETDEIRCTSEMLGKQPVEDLEEPRRGTRILMRIAIEEDTWRWNVSEARQCIRLSRLPGVKVAFNGEQIEHVRIGKQITELDWCTISANDSQGTVHPGMHIRAKGLYQFTTHLSGETCVFVDIPDLPSSVDDPNYPLTVSRESFIGRYNREVMEVANTMIIEPSTAEGNEPDGIDEWFDQFVLPPGVEPPQRAMYAAQSIGGSTPSGPTVEGEVLGIWEPPFEMGEGTRCLSPLSFGFGVMRHRDYDGVAPEESNRYLKILNIWHEMTVEAFSILGTTFSVDYDLHVGFTMVPNAAAAFYKEPQVGTFILVNPTKLKLSDPMKINVPILLHRLAEEIAHFSGIRLHGEDMNRRKTALFYNFMEPDNYVRMEEAYKRGEAMGI